MVGTCALTSGCREVVAFETIERRLRYRPPLAMDPLMRFLGDRAIPGVESFDGTTFRRAVRTPDGGPTVIAFTPRPDSDEVTLRMVTDEVGEPSALVRTARRLFDLDADPMEIDVALSADPALRPLVRSTPGIRVPGAADGFELAVRAILGQQVSVRAARTFAGRIAEASGAPLNDRATASPISSRRPNSWPRPRSDRSASRRPARPRCNG